MPAASAASALELLDDTARHEFWASLALRHTPGLGGRSARRLLATFGSAYAALRHLDRWNEAEVAQDKARAVASDKWRTSAKDEWNAARSLDGEVLLWTDSRYPDRLRDLPDAPVLLYAQGNLNLLDGPCVAVVGMRRCSAEGRRLAGAMAAGLAAAGVTVVSGLALGIDREAHVAALPLPGSTIAVLGTGLDREYPRSNGPLQRAVARQGLLLSEFAPDTPPDAKHFPIRNRIISGLSMGLLVVEAALRSGSLITARLALEQNRSVYAIPGSVGNACSEGCQELIRQGAQPVFSVHDILQDLKPLLRLHLHTPEPATSDEAAPSSTPAPTHPAAPTVPTPHPTTSLAAPLATPLAGPEKKTDAPPVQPTPTSPALPATRTSPAAPKALDLPSRLLVALAREAMDIDSLCRALDLSPSEVSRTLVQLEVLGRVRRLPDHRYNLP